MIDRLKLIIRTILYQPYQLSQLLLLLDILVLYLQLYL